MDGGARYDDAPTELFVRTQAIKMLTDLAATLAPIIGRSRRRAAAILTLIAIAPASGFATPLDDIGFTQLQTELGAAIPDGMGVDVTHVEANTGDPDLGEFIYAPNPASAEFSGKTLIDVTGLTTAFSGHAETVGRFFYGNTASSTPGITNVDVYLADHWLTDGFLTPDGVGMLKAQPLISSSRIANHSYVGAGDEDYPTPNLLRRMDWLVATDEFINVVGFNGSSSNPLFGSAFNTIAVNDTGSPSTANAQHVDSLYNGSRVGVDVVAPEANPSNAAPRAASVAALLAEAAHSDPSLSTDPVVTFTVNRDGAQVYNAERSEIVKASLMAGVDRETNNSNTGDIVGYRENAIDQTANGLDRRYGAGQLNVYNSYHIVTGAEQNSLEDHIPGGGQIETSGFDYDPLFGGLNGSNDEASYFFSSDSVPLQIFASLVWNIDIDGGTLGDFDDTATLYGLDLFLYDVSDAENWLLLSSSQSDVDNTENLWMLIDSGKDYAMQVRVAVGQAAFEWDYGLAWRMQAVPVPAAAWLFTSALGLLGWMSRKVVYSNDPIASVTASIADGSSVMSMCPSLGRMITVTRLPACSNTVANCSA